MARELKSWDPTISGTFAATAPLECMKMVLSNFMTEPADQHKSVASKVEQFMGQQVRRDEHRVILILDVSRAFFHPEIKRTVCCELPEEDKTDGNDQVGELLKTMYGSRDASAEWEGYYSEVFEVIVQCLSLLSSSDEFESMGAW